MGVDGQSLPETKELDSVKNDAVEAGDTARIDSGGAVQAWVVPTDEARQIAFETYSLLQNATMPS